MRAVLTLPALTLGFLASTAWGQLVVSESFDYADRERLLMSAEGGEGWKGPWKAHGEGRIEVVDGLAFDGLQSSGKAVRVLEPRRREQRLARAVGETADVPAGATVWVGCLFRADAEGSRNAVHEVRITENADDVYDSGPKDDPATLEIDESRNWFRRLRTHATMYGGDALDPAVDVHDDKRTDVDTELQTGRTYLVLARYTNVNDPASDVVGKVWVLDEQGFGSIADGPITVEELDEAAVDEAVESEGYDATFGPGDFVQLVGFENVAEVPLERPEPAPEATPAAPVDGPPAADEPDQDAEPEPVPTKPVPVGVFDELRIGVGDDPVAAGVLERAGGTGDEAPSP